MRCKRVLGCDEFGRECGNVLLMVLMILFMLTAFVAGHVAVFQKNFRQSNFFARHSALRLYADSGVDLAIHDLSYEVTGNGGNIGMNGWTVLSDVGGDGLAGTGDPGEGDGVPTPGEPGTSPVRVGFGEFQGDLLVRVEDTVWTRVKHIVSVVADGDAEAAVEAYVQQADNSIPHPGAVYVEPDGALDLNGNVFTISGADTNPDGTAGSEPTVAGIATDAADTSGENSIALTDQIATNHYDQVTGTGGSPSVGEATTVPDVDDLYNKFKSSVDQQVAPGSYSDVRWGSPDEYQVTYVPGDLDLSGHMYGAGVLLVDGNLSMSGQAKFEGVVIVRGSADLTGGGQGIHIFGSLIVGDLLSVSGNADIKFSSSAVAGAEKLLGRFFSFLYWRPLK